MNCHHVKEYMLNTLTFRILHRILYTISLAGLYVCLQGLTMTLSAQDEPSYSLTDTIYRYGTSLDSDIRNFAAIKLPYFQFACVDRLAIKQSNRHNTDFELSAGLYKEFYQLGKRTLLFSGMQGPDIFQPRSRQMMVFNEPWPLVSYYIKEDFYKSTSNEFVSVLSLEDMESDLKSWARGEGIEKLRLTGTISTTHSYKRADRFDDLDTLMQGFVTETEAVYSVDQIEIYTSQWQNKQLDEEKVLQDNFGVIRYRFQSFFPYDSMVEMARLVFEPKPYFYFHSSRQLGRHNDCKYLEESIHIYPNPTFGDLKAKFTNATKGVYNFTISNIIGKKIWSGQLVIMRSNQELPVKLPYLSKGVYLYNIRNPENKLVQSRRLIIVEP